MIPKLSETGVSGINCLERSRPSIDEPFGSFFA